MSYERDLEVPSDVTADPQSQEVLRAWVAHGQLICALCPTRWRDPSAWGILLADAARHVANAIRDGGGDEPSTTVAKIRSMFNLELKDPTDEPTGSFAE